MKLYDRTGTTRKMLEIDPEGFQMPYGIYSGTDLEMMQWKYFRLSNRPKTFLSVRTGNLIFGGVRRG